jgi:hypothetical protein
MQALSLQVTIETPMQNPMLAGFPGDKATARTPKMLPAMIKFRFSCIYYSTKSSKPLFV